MTKIVDYDFNNYIDTIALKEQIFFKDGGRKIDKYCFYKNRKETGLELSYKNDDDTNTGGYSMEVQTQIYGGRLYKTPKDFVKSDLPITIPLKYLQASDSNIFFRFSYAVLLSIFI